MTISMELTFDQLIKAIEKLRPEETERLARVVERHRREVGGIGAKVQRRLRQEALKRMLSMEETPVSDWDQMERGIALSSNSHGVVDMVLPITSADVTTTCELGNEYPHMAPRDWLHLAVMLNNGITEIISADRHFDDIEGITRLDPREFVQT